MKLFNSKEDSLYLTRKQWTKLFLAFSIMIIILYTVAMIFSLCGSTYFQLRFENEQMDAIQNWLQQNKVLSLLKWIFNTVEFCIVISFILKRFPKWYYVVTFYVIAMIVAAFIHAPAIFYTLYPYVFCIVVPLIDQIIENKNSVPKKSFDFKQYVFCLLRFIISIAITLILQIMIFTIKSGELSFTNHDMSFSSHFIYAIEYDIALSVILFTILLLYKEKGDSTLWMMSHGHGGSSQTSKTKSQKSSLKKNLTPKQRRKIRLLYAQVYLTQTLGFLLLMVLPFVLGKVPEFLTMYASFAISRYILGFNYSLHYKKESLCIIVGVIVFGILALAVPFFYVVLIIAVALGISLAVLLHLSYKYKGFYLFAKMAKPDKFALLYTHFDGNLDREYVKMKCRYVGMSDIESRMLADFTDGNKISFIAWKYNYSQRMTIYKLDELIHKLTGK